MNKKLFLIFFGYALLTRSVFVFSVDYCAFCDPAVIERQKFYEDDLVTALYTHKPIYPGHCLIIPKRHVERFELLSDSESIQIFGTIKKVNSAVVKTFGTSSYLLLQKNGHDAGQTVPHVHFHYIPRQEGNNPTIEFMLKMLWVNMLNPIDPMEMQIRVNQLKVAIE